jgi:hypothetical protein
MQLEKATKCLKRIWKAVVLVQLVALTGVLVFIFSHYFSYRIFLSNFRGQPSAATSIKNRR